MFKYTTVEAFLDKEECQEILDYSLSTLNLEKGKLGDSTVVEEIRKSSIAFTDYVKIFPKIISRLQDRLSELVNVKGYELDFEDQRYQFTEYKVGEFYQWHVDAGTSAKSSKRHCSVVIQLTDEYTGGDLELVDEEEVIKFKKGEGNLFVFLSKLSHRVTEVESGTRYTLVTWFGLKPVQNYKKTLL